jgi:hypothetical protein
MPRTRSGLVLETPGVGGRLRILGQRSAWGSKWTAVQNGVGNLAGVAAPALTGLVVTRTGQFFWAFAVATGVVLAGAFFYMFVIGRIEQVDWSPRR